MVLSVIDSHTHFKEKILKSLSEYELDAYVHSGVQVAIGMIDFYSDDLETKLSIIKKHAGILFGDAICGNIDSAKSKIIDFLKMGTGTSSPDIINEITKDFTIHDEEGNQILAASLNSLIHQSETDRLLYHMEMERIAARAIRNKLKIATYLCLGIHPNAIPRLLKDINTGNMNILESIEKAILSDPLVIGIGECGLEGGSKVEQDILLKQLLLSIKLDLPIVVHTPRDSKIDDSVNKQRALLLTLDIMANSGICPENVVLDHLMELENIDSILGRFKESRPYLGLSIQQNWLNPSRAVELINYVNSKGWFDRILIGSDFGTAQNPMAFSQVRDGLRKSNFTENDLKELFYKNPMRFFRLRDQDVFVPNGPSKGLVIDLRGVDDRALQVVEEIGLATKAAGNIDQVSLIGTRGMDDVLNRWCEMTNSETGQLPQYKYIYQGNHVPDRELNSFSEVVKVNKDKKYKAIHFFE